MDKEIQVCLNKVPVVMNASVDKLLEREI